MERGFRNIMGVGGDCLCSVTGELQKEQMSEKFEGWGWGVQTVRGWKRYKLNMANWRSSLEVVRSLPILTFFWGGGF